MSEQYHYTGATTPGNPGFDIDLGTAVVRLGGLRGLTQQAELGQVPSSAIDFDDPAGTLGIVGLKQFYVQESACPGPLSLTGSLSIAAGSTSLTGSGTAFTSQLYVGAGIQLAAGVAIQIESIASDTAATVTAGPALTYTSYSGTLAALRRIYNGYIGDRTYQRVPGTSLITGQARRIGMTIVDTNTLLSFRLIQPNDGTSPHAKRPAETDIARIDWLLSIDYLSDTLYDEGFIDRSNPINLDAADYTGQRAASVLNDCSQQSGKNHFVRYREATGHDVLHYRADANLAMDNSPLRLTNVLADVAADASGHTFLYERDAILTRDPSRVTAGVMVAYSGGQYYATNTGTIDAFGLRDQMAPNSNIKTLAKATAAATRYLADNSTEDDRITLTARLPAPHVNDALQGQMVHVKGTHWTQEGFGDFSPARVMLKTIKTDQETDQLYAVYFELSPLQPPPPNFLVAVLNRYGTTWDVPLDQSVNPWTKLWDSGDVSVNVALGDGGAWTRHGAQSIWYRAIVPGESATVLDVTPSSAASAWVYEIGGCDMSALSLVDSQVRIFDGQTGKVETTASVPSALLALIYTAKVDYDSGWCTGWPTTPNVVTMVDGTFLTGSYGVSGYNDCGPTPGWFVHGYDTGTGTLRVSGVWNTHGGGVGAYSSGIQLDQAGILIPCPGTFAIVQSAFAYNAGYPGRPFAVTLPGAPTP